jgi:hypothetical protein
MSHVDIALKFPLSIDGHAVKTVRMRRPTVADMLAADKTKGSDAEKEVKLFANLAELTPDDIGRLDMSDYAQLREAWASFLG